MHINYQLIGLLVLLSVAHVPIAADSLHDELDRRASAIETKVITWRRDFHQHPELANRELRTADIIAEHLRSLDFDRVQTEVAHTGVVGVLRGGKPGPVVALRAEMDAYIGTEQQGLPFASRVTTLHRGETVGVMHALNHDAHLAMLMGTAQVLAAMREQLSGTVKFIFQPAEEAYLLPPGERGGAKLMIEEGVLADPEPDVIFSLHGHNNITAGTASYRRGGMFASSAGVDIRLSGKQTYGAYPWLGQDLITTAAQIILALQTIPSRRLDITKAPALISIGKIHAGELANVIPGELSMSGIIRTLDSELEQDFYGHVKTTVSGIAATAGISADVQITQNYPPLYNDPRLADRVIPSLQRIFHNIETTDPILGGQQFSLFAEKVPGFYFYMGMKGTGDSTDIDESSMTYGVRALASLTFDYLLAKKTPAVK